jgi:hypothetical protein
MKMKIVIPENATLQAFLLLLFSKCQHSNDFIAFYKNTPTILQFVCKQSQNTRYCHKKIMFMAATYLKIIRKHYMLV